jgi:hypothetical protein
LKRERKKMTPENTGIPRDIICSHCGFKGKIRARDTEVQFSSDVLFNPLGKNPEGFLYFKCPSCLREFRIDPFELLPFKQATNHLLFTELDHALGFDSQINRVRKKQDNPPCKCWNYRSSGVVVDCIPEWLG